MHSREGMPADPYPPLISPRSPSYARARREAQNPSPAGGAEVVALVARLSEAEENARQACSKIAEIVKDESLASQVHGAAAIHQAHRETLGELIEALGGSAPRPDECRAILTRGADAVAGATSDPAALESLKVTRGELAAAYEEAIRDPLLGDVQRATLSRLAASLAT